jgi:hypothetical protein
VYSDGSIDPLTNNVNDKLPMNLLPAALGSRQPAPPVPHSTPSAGPSTQTHSGATLGIPWTAVVESRRVESESMIETEPTVKTEETEPHIVNLF